MKPPLVKEEPKIKSNNTKRSNLLLLLISDVRLCSCQLISKFITSYTKMQNWAHFNPNRCNGELRLFRFKTPQVLIHR